jgi:predicted enzyme related to lactoylglutathione lyase
LREFYAELFGWKIDASNAMGYGFIEAGIGGPEAIAGGILGGDQPRMIIYVQVADLAETLERAEALGGRRVMERLDIPDRPSIAQAADPEGNIIGLVQQ